MIYITEQLGDREAHRKIGELKTMYENLRERFRHQIAEEDVMTKLHAAVESLDDRPEYQENLEPLCKKDTAKGFYKILKKSISYLDFDGILDHLIRRCGDSELQEDAIVYRRQLLDLLGRVTVMQAAQGSFFPVMDKDIPQGFTKVKTHVETNPDGVRLIDVIQYRNKFASEVRMSHLVFRLMAVINQNSFLLVWLVPTVIVPILEDAIKKVDVRFFRDNEISSVSIMKEEIIYPAPGKSF